jgi:MFS transporter, ACS family, aldohexuronate transporter
MTVSGNSLETQTITNEVEVTRPQKSSVRWTICALLFFATSINYMDRQVLSILAPTLQHSIGWNEAQYGYIVGAFQAAYAIGLLLAGYVVDKLGSRIGYAVVMAIWSLAAMGHALARSAFGFGVARFFLGLGESGNFPVAIKTTAEWFPQKERSLATGIFNSGTNVGAIVAPALISDGRQRFSRPVCSALPGLRGGLRITASRRSIRR